MKKIALFSLIVATVSVTGANAGWREKLGLAPAGSNATKPAPTAPAPAPAPAPVVEETAAVAVEVAEPAPVVEPVVEPAPEMPEMAEPMDTPVIDENVGGFVPNPEPAMVEMDQEIDMVE